MGPIRALIAFAAALIALAPGLAAAQVPAPAVTSAGPDNVAVTIYRESNSGDATLNLGWLTGYALITETRTVMVPAGRSTIRFEGVAGGIMPESAIVSGLPDGVLEKNLDADLLSPRTLYGRSFGRPVMLRRIDAEGRMVEERGIIRSGPDGAAIIQTQDGFIAADCTIGNESLVYEGVPAGLSAKPTLSIETVSPTARQVTITLSYLAWGFDWQANYVATMRPDGKTADMVAWVTLASSDVTSFADAETMVVAGTVNRDENSGGRQPLQTGGALQFKCLATHVDRIVDAISAQDMGQLPDRSVNEALQRVPGVQMMAVSAITVVSVENLGDLKLYRVPHRTTVAAYSMKQVALFQRESVPVDIYYAATVYPSADSFRVLLSMRFQNRKDAGLGLALPAGNVALFEPAAGTRLLVGEAAMGDRAEGEEIELGVSDSTQVSLRFGPAPAGRGRKTRVLTASNANPYPVQLEVTFAGYPEGKPVRASQRLGRRDGYPIWIVEVPANGSVSLRVRN